MSEKDEHKDEKEPVQPQTADAGEPEPEPVDPSRTGVIITEPQ